MRIVLFLLAFVAGVCAQFDAQFRNGNVIVHLFEWPWNDIAEECERFLGPYGFGGVQVSPANQHIDGSQWWTRYQPVSYNLNSRSGSEWEFSRMVERCNAVNVNIYVDVVINHMAAWNYYFSDVPYGTNDFNVPLGYCPSYNNEINNYYDVNEVRNCNLVGLNDLYVGSEYVRSKIADFLNKYVSYGVAGFRIDAAKHMWPGDLEAIVGRLQNVWWGGKPYVYQEVIDMDTGEPIKCNHYTYIGDVTEFRHSVEISKLGWCKNNLAYYGNFGEAWGFLPNDCAVVFVDNHDNQRNHGGGGDIVTHKDPASYKRAVAFMLAWNYGTKRIMSSYSFNDNDQGPPSGSIPINADSTCGGGWVCEHRWRQIRNMVTFSAVAGSEPVQNWWDNGYNQIAFSRGNKAFFTMTCEGAMSGNFYTGLPDGTYCDVISGDCNGYGGCTGTTVYVSGGYASITVPSGEDSMVAIHVGAMADGSSPVTQPTGGDHTSPAGYARTVIFIYKETSTGQDMFIRGGIDHSMRSGCTENADSSPCAIPIIHRTGGTDPNLSNLRKGDDYLDWYGSESDQTSDAPGTPLVWTTNNPNHGSSCDNQGYGYTPMNQWGDHYWMLDVDMDCSKTEDGWFEFKGYVQGGDGWESDRSQSTCGGSAGGTKPYSTGNHFGRCGFVNMFVFNDNSCEISPC